MADVQLFGGKKLTELRVVDLRQELEKRGLEKSGVKAILVERLQKALEAQAAEEKKPEEVKDETKDEVKEESEDIKPKESAESSTELNISKSEIKSEPGDPDAAGAVPTPPKRSSVKPAKKMPKKKATSEKETPVKDNKEEEQKDNSEDELLQESFDGEGVIMKIIDECQDDQGNRTEGMEINESMDVDELFKDESLNIKAEEEREEKKDELGLSLEESDINMETGSEVKEAKGSEEVPTSSKDDISLGDNSADSIRGDTSAMDTSEVDSSKENGWSVSLIVHTDGIQDDLDEELKAAEKAEEAAKENKEEQKRKEELKEKEKDEKTKDTDKKDEKKDKPSETSEKASKSEGKSSTESKDTPKSSAKKTPDKKASTAKKGTTDSKAKGAPTAKEKKESGKSLWVSYLSSITRAADLKTRFSQHGKVVGAKIVTNSKAPGAQCFGLVTMSTSEEAAKCISHLHRTELHGRTITVDRAKGDRIPSQGGTSATKKQADKKQADKKATNKSQEKGKADDKKQTDKGKKPNEKTTKPSGKQSTGSSPSVSKTDETTQEDAKKTEDSSDRVVVMDDNKGEPVVVVANKPKDDSKSRSASRGRKSKSSEKSNGSPIKSLEEIRRQRVEKQRQDRAREMRDQRERERTLRIRRERERIARERAIEREREREREKERERRRQQFLREQRQKQEQERLRLQRELERRRELERLRREREERERLERERRERELIMERERINRERIETDRLKRIERERLERQRVERERVDRERVDRERLERLDRERRGSGIKRSAAPFERDTSASQRAGFWQDSKRAAVEGSRPDNREFFGGSLGSHDAVPSRRPDDKVQMDRRDSKGHRDDGRGHSRSGSRDGRRDDDFSSRDDRRRKDDHSRRGEVRDSRKDVRHVSDRDKGWSERMTSAGNMGPIDPQKSLSILLERAGVSGILGNNAPGVRSDLGKGMDLDIGRSLASDHRGGDWRQADLRDGRPPVMSADRGQHMPVVGAVDSRYGAMEHAHRPSAVVADQVKVTSRDWRGDPNAELIASRSRSRARGMDSKSAPHSYESRDRTVLSRDTNAVRGAWGGDALRPSGPPLPGRGMIDDRSRGTAIPREAVPPGWAVGSMPPVGDVRGAYGGGAGPDRRHSGGGADVRYDPYKVAAQRSSGMRRY